MELLGAPLLDLGQTGEQRVATRLEVAERLQARDAALRRVRVEPSAGAGLQVRDDRAREVALELRDLPAQLPARGVLVAVEARGPGERRQVGRGHVGTDRVRAGRCRLVLLAHRFQCFDPAHRHLLATSSSSRP